MARYPYIRSAARDAFQRSRRRGQGPRWIYIISALLIIAVSYFGYRIASQRARMRSISRTTIGTNVGSETSSPEPVALTPKSETEPEPIPVYQGAPGIAAEPNPRAAELITEAMAYISDKPVRIIDARDRLNETLPVVMSAQQRAVAKEELSQLADKWLFSRTIFTQDRLCGSYRVEPGDQLRTIGKQFKVPYEILMGINKIRRPEALQAGETIKIINGPFHARVYRSTFTMDLYLQNTFVRSFPVGLGQEGMETPTGLWRVKPGGKLITPTWTDPVSGKTYEAQDPDYPLGSRWIGLEGIRGDAKDRDGFAIHGVKDPNEIGTAISQGCIRLHNGDAILIYNLLMPGFSRVEVVE